MNFLELCLLTGDAARGSGTHCGVNYPVPQFLHIPFSPDSVCEQIKQQGQNKESSGRVRVPSPHPLLLFIKTRERRPGGMGKTLHMQASDPRVR